MRNVVMRVEAARLADPDGINWAGVPEHVREDDEFCDMARQLKGVEAALGESSGRYRDALSERFDSLVARMRARWNQLVGN